MGRIERQITEELTILVLGNEIDGVISQVVGDVSFAAHQLAVMVKLRVEILPPVAGGEPIKFVKAACIGMVRKLGTVVPLAKRSRRVTRGFERLRDRHLVEVETFKAGGDSAHAAAGMVAA